MRCGIRGFSVAKHLHGAVSHGEQAEGACRKSYDALVVDWAESGRNRLLRLRVVLRTAGVEFHVAVDDDQIADLAEPY